MALRSPVFLFAIAAAAATGPAQALSCRSGIYGGTVEFRCSQPENVTSSCRWSATLEAEDGSSGMRSGTFLLPPRASDLVVVSESRFGGKKIVRGTVKLEGCAIGLVGPAASDAAAELAKPRVPLASVAPAASGMPGLSRRPPAGASRPVARPTSGPAR